MKQTKGGFDVCSFPDPAMRIAQTVLFLAAGIATLMLGVWLLVHFELIALPAAVDVSSRGTRYAAFREWSGGLINAATSLGRHQN